MNAPEGLSPKDRLAWAAAVETLSYGHLALDTGTNALTALGLTAQDARDVLRDLDPTNDYSTDD